MEYQVYRNLNKKGYWSIRAKVGSKWIVQGYSKDVTLENVTVKQSTAARDTVRRTGQKSVHCVAVGTIVAAPGFESLNGRTISISAPTVTATPTRVVTYNPYKHATLVYAADESEFSRSTVATFAACVMTVA